VTRAIDLFRRCAGVAAAACAAVLSVGVEPADAQQQPYLMKLTTAARNEATHEWIKRFGEAVGQRSGGRIKVDLYPGGALGDVPRQIEGLQLATIEGMSAPPAFFVGLDQRYQLTDTPGLFDDMQHAFASVTDPSVRDKFLSVGQDKGVKNLSFFTQGPLTLVSRKPVVKLDDLRGMKIRVFASPFQTEPIARFGAVSAPMPLLEVLPSLQNGVIDGSIGSLSILLTFKYESIATDVVYMPYGVVTMVGSVSKPWFDKLPRDLQSLLVNAGREVESGLNAWAIDVSSKQDEQWKARGGKLRSFTPEEIKRLRETARATSAEIVKTRPELKELYDAMVASAAKHRKS
jgi:TRAP-type C4-dicarboxylate transport system substrate-binding protein